MTNRQRLCLHMKPALIKQNLSKGPTIFYTVCGGLLECDVKYCHLLVIQIHLASTVDLCWIKRWTTWQYTHQYTKFIIAYYQPNLTISKLMSTYHYYFLSLSKEEKKELKKIVCRRCMIVCEVAVIILYLLIQLGPALYLWGVSHLWAGWRMVSPCLYFRHDFLCRGGWNPKVAWAQRVWACWRTLQHQSTPRLVCGISPAAPSVSSSSSSCPQQVREMHRGEKGSNRSN